MSPLTKGYLDFSFSFSLEQLISISTRVTSKTATLKAISKKKKSFFQEKIEKNANNSKELWKALKSSGTKLGKVNQSKIALKNDGAIQFEPMKNAF